LAGSAGVVLDRMDLVMTLPRNTDPRRQTRDGIRAWQDACHIWGALLPTYRVPSAGLVRDMSPLVEALRNPAAIELVTAWLDGRKGGA
jgi:hypothetical protein